MCFSLIDSFIRSFLLLFIIRNGFLNSIFSGYATLLNNSDEIKTIFGHGDDNKNIIHPELKDTFRNVNFAEGGLISNSYVPNTHISSNKIEQILLNNTKKSSTSSGFVEKQYETSLQKNESGTMNSTLKSSTYKTLQDVKLPDSGTDLFLGIPKVTHINGSSSVKPRKGVNYDKIDNKIVPRKGVDIENKKSFSFLSNYSCFQLSKNDCYNAEETQDLECSCCKKGNPQGELFKQLAVVSCSKCKPMLLSSSEKTICENICCKPVFHDINSISGIHDDFLHLKNKSKLKPTITKVPYDVEVVTELLSKAKQKVFIPVVVSLLLLPFFGLFLFLIWKRTKEYWDKRCYKRMDFLIDGMYND